MGLWQRIGMLCLFLLTGCAPLNPNTGQEPASTIHVARGEPRVTEEGQRILSDDVVLRFVASAEVGETRMITNGRSGKSVLISVGEFYQAASGHLCRCFFRSISDKTVKPRTCTSRIACRDRTGGWYRVRQIVNIDRAGIGISGCLSAPLNDPLKKSRL
jgi:hypothetical protein